MRAALHNHYQNLISQLVCRINSYKKAPLESRKGISTTKGSTSKKAVICDYLQFYVSVKSDPFTRLSFVPQPYAPSLLATRIYENAFLMRFKSPFTEKKATTLHKVWLSRFHLMPTRDVWENVHKIKLYFLTPKSLWFSMFVLTRPTRKKCLNDKTFCSFFLAGKQLREQIFLSKEGRVSVVGADAEGVKNFQFKSSQRLKFIQNLFMQFLPASFGC